MAPRRQWENAAVVVDALQVAPGALFVDLAHPRTARKATDRGGQGGFHARFARFSPVVEQIAEVRQRVAERTQLPIEEGSHAPVLDEHVADAVVAVDDGRTHLLRHVLVQQARAFLHPISGSRGSWSPPTAASSASAGGRGTLPCAPNCRGRRRPGSPGAASPAPRRVFAGRAPLGFRHRFGHVRLVRRHALDEGHQVEGLTVDGLVLAQAVGLRHRARRSRPRR